MSSPVAPQHRQTLRRIVPIVSPKSRPKAAQNTPTKAAESSTSLNKVNIGAAQPSKLHDSSDTRERVLKWQSVGGFISSPAEGSDDGNESKVVPAPKPLSWQQLKEQVARDKALKEKTASRDAEAPFPDLAREEILHNQLNEDIRIASAPRKRVVSDEHWKKSRPTTEQRTISPGLGPETPSPGKQIEPYYVRPGSKRCDAWVKVKTPPTKPSPKPKDDKDAKREYRQSRHDRLSSRKKQPVDIGAWQSPEIPEGTKLEDKSPGMEVEKSPSNSTKYDPRTPQSTDKIVESDKFSPCSSPSAHKSTHLKRPSYLKKPAENPPPLVQAPLYRRKSGSRNWSEAGSTELDGGDSVDVQQILPPLFGNRIDAWLTDTPDPFIDNVDRLKANAATPPLDKRLSLTAPRSKSVGRKDLSSESRTEEDIGRHARAGRVRSRTASPLEGGSGDQTDVKHDVSPKEDAESTFASAEGAKRTYSPPTPTLKRSGARRNLHSPKRQTLEDLQPKHQVEESSSVDYSVIDISAVYVHEHKQSGITRCRVPTTGNRLSTIASVESFPANAREGLSMTQIFENASRLQIRPADGLVSEANEKFNPDALNQHQPGLKRKTTSHVDLLSVLSMPKDSTRGLRSARSIHTTRRSLDSATIEELIDELQTYEMKYSRELRTLVDGVIPVLLSCVLSKSNASAAAELFGHSKDNANVTAPIVGMGITLERLKSAHMRIPTSNMDAFLAWAQGAYRIYEDYLKAWRMGFQDVVVNLAPAVESSLSSVPPRNTEPTWDADLRRDAQGDIIDGDGEKVEVAFLLKRPLVRLKYLTKTLRGIQLLKQSEQAERWADKYQELVEEARRRQNEERARLEDEAAADVDASRTRDPRTLAPLAHVQIERSRCVRARDFFDMKLQHSSGQRVDCHVELLLRDDPPERGSTGDVLICEVDSSSRWLLFPPIPLSLISARNGDSELEIVIMIRGHSPSGQEWHELVSLRAPDKQTGYDWVQMLGLLPVPHGISLPENFSDPPIEALVQFKATALWSPTNILAVNRLEVPIGEQASEISQKWEPRPSTGDNARSSPCRISPIPPKIPPRPLSSPPLPASTARAANLAEMTTSAVGSSYKDHDAEHVIVPRSLNEAMLLAGTDSNLRRLVDTKRSSHHPSSTPLSPHIGNSQNFEHSKREASTQKPRSQGDSDSPRTVSQASSTMSHASKGYTVWYPTQEPEYDDEDGASSEDINSEKPYAQRRTSSVPSKDMPVISRIRAAGNSSKPADLERQDRFASDTSLRIKRKEAPSTPRSDGDIQVPQAQDQVAPQTPTHSSAIQLRMNFHPQLSPTQSGPNIRRRSSSPLKHEYEPSTASELSADAILPSDDEGSITSESSTDIVSPAHLPPMSVLKAGSEATPSYTVYSPPNPPSLSPSQSASQAQYRTVLPQTGTPLKTIASIFCWSDRGLWESIHPQECSIMVSPGLIEAFEMTAAHSISVASAGDADLNACPTAQPLVALELTPLVPLRRGTAIDISIRSPPTPNSQIQTGNNIMFRSRNGPECEALYAMINHARINNPTYVALQNARGPFGESSWAAQMDRRASLRNQWWRFGSQRNSYRSGSTRRTISIAPSESSVATMSSAMSVLRRFNGGSKIFNVAKSTVTSRGSRSHSSRSFSSSTGSGSSTPVTIDPSKGTPLGITDMKIRLYERETASKWRDMGSAHLTIMHPPRPSSLLGPSLTPQERLKQEKRILVMGKMRGETLLDVTLGETCFERVARTGIAVSVQEQLLGPNGEVGQVGKTGGVVATRVRVYMLQMKSEAETAYIFSLVGRMRY